MHLTLACGPYIPEYWWVAVVSYFVLKPIAYFAFIQAFRFRVSREIPMTLGHAARLTLLRSGLGVLFFGAGYAVMAIAQRNQLLIDALLMYSWMYLYVERLVAWFIVGRWGASLRGRRLVGWCISGTLINAAFDFGVIAGLFEGWVYIPIVVAGLAVFIGLLHAIGRRPSLRARFTTACNSCSYNLTGNLSGFCPECGTPIAAAA